MGQRIGRFVWRTSGMAAVILASLALAAGIACASDSAPHGWRAVSCIAWKQRILTRVEQQERTGTIWAELAEDVRLTLARITDACPVDDDNGPLKRMVALFDLLSEIEDEP